MFPEIICRNLSIFMCIASLAFSEDKTTPHPEPFINIDLIVDTVLSEVLNDEKLNPLVLRKNYRMPINQNIGFIPITGELKIAHGHVYGLTSIVRSGHSQIHYNDDGNAEVNVPLALNGSAVVLEADVSGHLNGLPTIAAIPMEAKVSRMATEFVITMSIDRKLSLKKFCVEDIDDIQIRLQDSIPIPYFGKLFDILTKVFMYIFNKKIKTIIEQTCTPILAEELKNYPVPI